jgi:hypothetical protein
MEQILIASDKYENEKITKNCCFSVFNKIFVSFENGNDVFVKCDVKILSTTFFKINFSLISIFKIEKSKFKHLLDNWEYSFFVRHCQNLRFFSCVNGF